MTGDDTRQIYDMLQDIAGKLGVLEARSHTPANCPLSLLMADFEKRMKEIETAKAKAMGFLSAVHIGLGALAGLGGGGIVIAAQKLLHF